MSPYGYNLKLLFKVQIGVNKYVVHLSLVLQKSNDHMYTRFEGHKKLFDNTNVTTIQMSRLYTPRYVDNGMV